MTTAFIHGNIVDVINETLIKDGTVVVEDGIIREAGTGVAVPDGAAVVDLEGRTVTPGLFNCHVHMCSDAGTGVRERISQPTHHPQCTQVNPPTSPIPQPPTL